MRKQRTVIIFALIIGLISTFYLFKLGQDIHGLYERKN